MADSETAQVAVWVRWICFLILVASTLLSLPARFPGNDAYEHLLDDVRHGHASSVTIESLAEGSTASRVRWKTDLVAWHATTTSKPVDRIRADLDAAAGPAGISVDTSRSPSPAGLHMNVRLFTIGIWEPLAVITGAMWLATFLGMLFTSGHPYANRWAWFWLFVVGGVGPMLILWKEPTPLRIRFWRRHAEPSRRPPRSPMTGGTGLLTAIGWTIVLTGAAYAVGWASSTP